MCKTCKIKAHHCCVLCHNDYFVALAGRENTLYCGQLPAIGLPYQFEMFFLAMKNLIVHGGFAEKCSWLHFQKKGILYTFDGVVYYFIREPFKAKQAVKTTFVHKTSPKKNAGMREREKLF